MENKISTAKAILKTAEEKLGKEYGPQVPAAFLCRFETENLALANSEMPLHYEFLHRIRELSNALGKTILVRGTTASSYIAWLLGATEVNPAPPHLYCEHCKKVVFLPDLRDGWDAVSATCSCGSVMSGDGHGIPFDEYGTSLNESGIHLDIEIAPSLLPEAEELLLSYYAGWYSPTLVDFGETSTVSRKYLLLGPDEACIDSEQGRMVSREDAFRKYAAVPSINFICLPVNETALTVSPNVDCHPVTPERLQKAYEKLYSVMEAAGGEDEDQHRAFSEIAAESKKYPLSFSLLMRMELLLHSPSCWMKNGDKLVKEGTVSLLNLPVCREDVLEMFYQSELLIGDNGRGIALKYVRAVRRGHFALGKEQVNGALLLELGMPEWLPDYFRKITYLFPKAHEVEMMIKTLRNV